MKPNIPKRQVPPLQRDRIVAAALTVMNRDGFAKVTLRQVAAELHVQAPALYWHFKNKQALINAMYECVFSTQPTPDTTSSAQEKPWREVLADVGLHVRRVLLTHRDATQLILYAELYESAMLAQIDGVIDRMARTGLRQDHGLAALSVVVSYTLGFVIEEEANQHFTMQKAARNPERLWTAVEKRNLTNVRLAFETMAQAKKPDQSNGDEAFIYGLSVIVSGIAAGLPAET